MSARPMCACDSISPGMSVPPSPSITLAGPAGGATPAATSAIRSPSMRTEPANGSRPVPSRILTLVISTVSTVSPFPARLWNDGLLAIQELLDAAGDALDVEAVLGVEALGIAGLAEADHAEPLDRRRQHLAQRLGHGAA